MRDVVLNGVIGNDVESVGRLDLKGVDLFDGFGAMSVIHASANVIPGFKAYFVDNSGSGVKAFRFDSADAIESIVNGQLINDNAVIYNLAGQRISKLQKGVNIVNGKKVLVK